MIAFGVFTLIGAVLTVLGVLMATAGYLVRKYYTMKQPESERKAVCYHLIRNGWRLFGIGLVFILVFGLAYYAAAVGVLMVSG